MSAEASWFYLLVKVCGPPGGGDELLKPRLLHPQRSLDVKKDNGAQDVERGPLLRRHSLNFDRNCAVPHYMPLNASERSLTDRGTVHMEPHMDSSPVSYGATYFRLL